jgi:hypothetical protein
MRIIKFLTRPVKALVELVVTFLEESNQRTSAIATRNPEMTPAHVKDDFICGRWGNSLCALHVDEIAKPGLIRARTQPAIAGPRIALVMHYCERTKTKPLPNGLALSCLPQRDSSVLPGGGLSVLHVCVLALRFTNANSVSLSAWLGGMLF